MARTTGDAGCAVLQYFSIQQLALIPPMHSSHSSISLRPTHVSDLPALAAFQSDPVANQMAAFTAPDPNDHAAYITKWTRLLADPSIVARVVLLDGKILGTVGSWVLHDERQVTYWMDRSVWGQGVATEALRLFLAEYSERPLHGRLVADNIGSKRVLEKCGFVANGTDRGFAHARKTEVEELLYILR